MTVREDLPRLFVSMPHECEYLEDRIATTLFVDPSAAITRGMYSALVRQGFRRSGNLVYRPHCQACNACIPARIAVDRFRPNRSQRRIRTRNQDLVARQTETAFQDEHFTLYRRYQRARHGGGSMDIDNPDRYRDFLFGTVGDTRVYEFRTETPLPGAGALMAVAVIDFLGDGLSAVYTFFDPAEPGRGLGVFSVLFEIELARCLGLPWLYLGYYIAESPKMRYKAGYRPLEVLRGGAWKEMTNQETCRR